MLCCAGGGCRGGGCRGGGCRGGRCRGGGCRGGRCRGGGCRGGECGAWTLLDDQYVARPTAAPLFVLLLGELRTKNDGAMNRLFFRDADAAAGAAAPAVFNLKMLAGAEPAPNKNECTQKQKGKSKKWNQEEEARRAICERNRLPIAKTYTPLQCQKSNISHCPTEKNVSHLLSVCSNCLSITEISDSGASDFSSPCSARSQRICSPIGEVEDVEIRRGCTEGETQWGPYLMRDAADVLMASGLLSPVPHFAGTSPGGLVSSLDLSEDRNCGADLSGYDRGNHGVRANIVAETPAGVSRRAAEGCSAGSAAASPCGPDAALQSKFWQRGDAAAVVLETPFKIDGCDRADASLISTGPTGLRQSEAVNADGVGGSDRQSHADTLLREFSALQLDQETAVCGASNVIQNVCAACDRETCLSSMAAAPQLPTTTRDQELKQCNSQMITFPALQLALAFYSGHLQQPSLHVWAEEFSLAGARKFLVASCDAFARYSLGPRFSGGRRHFYEVIPEGRACNLYVDIEWTRKDGANSWIDDESVLRTLVRRLCAFMATVFAGVQCGSQQVMHLDSSTQDKFSRHLVINAASATEKCERLARALFVDNVHAGAFMADFVAHESQIAGLTVGQVIDPLVLQQMHEENEAARLFCFNADGALTFCVDTGVYNKNRCFRLPLSSKYGKSAVLLPHYSNEMPLDGTDVFLLKASLVCPCDGTIEAGGVRLLSHLRALQSQDVRSGMLISSFRSSQSQRSLKFTSRTNAHRADSTFGNSIDDSILDNWASKTGLSGQCCGTKASIVSGRCLVSYALTKANRWCERVGRQHRSNCTFLVADMCAGVYWQSCWDADCKGFKSQPYAIPGWNAEHVHAHVAACCGDSALRLLCERSEDAETQLQQASETAARGFSAWASQGNFIDAELHEELIWMEAAILCERSAEMSACKSTANTCMPTSELENDSNRVVKMAQGDDPSHLSQTRPGCRDFDDWYSDDIESEIHKLEQQQISLCDAQSAFETALLQWRPVYGSSP